MNEYLPLLGLAMFVGVVGGLGLFANYLQKLKNEEEDRQRAESQQK